MRCREKPSRKGSANGNVLHRPAVIAGEPLVRILGKGILNDPADKLRNSQALAGTEDRAILTQQLPMASRVGERSNTIRFT